MDYFDSMCQQQLERQEEGIDNWDKMFLDLGKTWCNIRKTCKGFIAYCRAAIQYAATNREKIPKCVSVAVAHSNSSVLEAWFSLVRGMNFDSATAYEGGVGNITMQNTCSLKTNRMYCTTQAGKIIGYKAIGPAEVIKFYTKRQESVLEFVEKKYLSKLDFTS